MKKLLLVILILNSFFLLNYPLNSKGFDSAAKHWQTASTYETENTALGTLYEDLITQPTEAVCDLSFQGVGEPHRPTMRRMQTNRFQFVLRLQAALKRHYILLKNSSTALDFIALRKTVPYPLPSFTRTCDYYVFSFGHILH